MKYVGALGKTMALSLSSRPSLFTSSIKNTLSCFPIRQFRNSFFVLYPSKNCSSTRNKLLRCRSNSFSTHAVATDSSEAPAAADERTNGDAPVEKIVLPTNESSDTLLRVRHTVMYIFWIFYLGIEETKPFLLY